MFVILNSSFFNRALHMSPLTTCPRCGKPQPARVLVSGLCPSCLAGSVKMDLLALDEPVSDEMEPRSIVVPGYDIVELIGGGGMGEVYRATVTGHSKFVAIKVVAGRLTRDPEVTARFEAEVAAMSQLDHPNVLRVLDHGEKANGRHFLVMEYVDGCDLRRLLRAQRLETDRAFDIFLKVCAGVAHAHERGLAHRDIKPANVLIGQDGTVKVADFGLAKTLADTAHGYSFTQTRDTFGTPYYVAPEVTRDAGAADARADVYALGVLLYELLSGTVPMGQFTPLSQKAGVDRRIDNVVKAALADDPAKRLSSVCELSDAVQRIADHHRRRPMQQRRKKRALAAAAVFAVLGIGAAAGAWLTRNRVVNVHPVFVPPATASKERPWENSLGMKFVPVPDTNLLFSIWETRVRDFEIFFDADSAVLPDWRSGGNDPRSMLRTPTPAVAALIKRGTDETFTWREPGFGFKQTGEHPVCGMSLMDARMFCAWLTWRERQEGRISKGQRYRLPTDDEWDKAAQVKSDTIMFPSPFDIEQNVSDPNAEANFAGPEALEVQPWPMGTGSLARRDPFPRSAPVGSFKANALGIFDLAGNVAEWTSTEAPPRDASQRQRMYFVRGGSWGTNMPRACRLDAKQIDRMTHGKPIYGFRVVLDLKAPPATPRVMDAIDEDDVNQSVKP